MSGEWKSFPEHIRAPSRQVLARGSQLRLRHRTRESWRCRESWRRRESWQCWKTSSKASKGLRGAAGCTACTTTMMTDIGWVTVRNEYSDNEK